MVIIFFERGGLRPKKVIINLLDKVSDFEKVTTDHNSHRLFPFIVQQGHLNVQNVM